MTEPLVRIEPGANLWIVEVSDKGGPSRDEVIGRVVDALAHWFGVDWEMWQRLEAEGGVYRIGEARPLRFVRVERLRAGQSEPEAWAEALAAVQEASETWRELADYQSQAAGTYAIVGDRPWYVTIEFQWRGTGQTIPWPGFKRGWGAVLTPGGVVLGPAMDLQSQLLWAAHDPGIVDPNDATWIEQKTEQAAELAGAAVRKTPYILIGVGIVAAVALLYRYGRKGKR